jgi:hypothetical protein
MKTTENAIFAKTVLGKLFLQNKKWTFLKCPFSKIKNTFSIKITNFVIEIQKATHFGLIDCS